jgi:hypothetical protein
LLAAVQLRALFRGGTEEEEMAGALLLARGLRNLDTIASALTAKE